MPLVRITAVGALVKPEGSDRYRPKIRGDRVSVSDEDAQRYVADGTAVLVDDAVAPNAEEEQPDGGAIDLDSMTIPALRKFADRRRPAIDLGDLSRKKDIVEAIEAALTDPDEPPDDGAPDNRPESEDD